VTASGGPRDHLSAFEYADPHGGTLEVWSATAGSAGLADPDSLSFSVNGTGPAHVPPAKLRHLFAVIRDHLTCLALPDTPSTHTHPGDGREFGGAGCQLHGPCPPKSSGN